MSHIRSKDTLPEVTVRKYLFSKGLRYRKYYKCLPGTPDIVLPKYHTVVFVNGCFWHRHRNADGTDRPCFVMPKSNTDYWKEKINRNVNRDEEEYCALKAEGWHVLIVWECELKKSVREKTLNDIYNQIINFKG